MSLKEEPFYNIIRLGRALGNVIIKDNGTVTVNGNHSKWALGDRWGGRGREAVLKGK